MRRNIEGFIAEMIHRARQQVAGATYTHTHETTKIAEALHDAPKNT